MSRTKQKTINLLRQCIKQSLAPPEQITVSDWAEKYRKLNESSSMPGPWHNSITPYLVEIMDCFNDPYIHNINFVKSTQVGGTEALINATGWIVTQNPSPTMIVYPTDDLAKDVSNDKLKPAYRSTPAINERFYRTRSNEMNLKFRGMSLYLRSGGSPSKLASKAIKYLFFDEIDKMAGATKNEASPYNLAVERTKTFKYSRKIYTCSTPTYRENYIWRLHEAADEQRHYFLPCPHCGEYIELLWKQVKYDSDAEKKLTNSARAATAVYVCQECGGIITDKDKQKMLQKGEWRDMKGTCRGKAESVSFYINSMYSFFVNWSDIVKEFLETKDNPETLQNFVNSWLAEPWEDTAMRVNPELVLERQAPEVRGEIPEWAEMITAGADVQRNCVYFDIVAWGPQMTSQSIIHGQLLSLEDLDAYMNAEYRDASGRIFTVNLCLVDSGDQTDTVYNFCITREWAVPVKGASSQSIGHYRISKVNKAGASSQQLVLINSSKYKELIIAKLHVQNGAGSCMVHAECDEEYAKQLASEHKIAVGMGANRKYVWQTKTVRGDNHYLDCRVYASAAADISGVRTLDIPSAPQSEERKRQREKRNQWLNI